MNVTEEEINKFVSLFWREDYECVRDFLSSKKAFGIYTSIRENGSGFIRMEEACDADSYGHYNISYPTTKRIRFNSRISKYPTTKRIRFNSHISKKDIDFVLSFISRYFENFKLIFSSSTTHVFVTTTENMQATVREVSYIDSDNKTAKFLVADLFSHGDAFVRIHFSEYKGDLSDELWNIRLNHGDNSERILSAYASGKYAFPEKIEKRINDLYESLSDSDKLLLELGEKI